MRPLLFCKITHRDCLQSVWWVGVPLVLPPSKLKAATIFFDMIIKTSQFFQTDSRTHIPDVMSRSRATSKTRHISNARHHKPQPPCTTTPEHLFKQCQGGVDMQILSRVSRSLSKHTFNEHGSQNCARGQLSGDLECLGGRPSSSFVFSCVFFFCSSCDNTLPLLRQFLPMMKNNILLVMFHLLCHLLLLPEP